jgi:hypothetical protein
MKLTSLFSRAQRRVPHPDETDAPAGLVHDGTDHSTDRSSMAELVRLLHEVEEPPTGGDGQPS